MGKNKKKGSKGNVFKVAGAKSLKKTKAKAVTLGLKNADYRPTTCLPAKYRKKNVEYLRRSYIDYTKAQLEACLEAVRSKELTQHGASVLYQIPRSTIKYKLYNKSTRNPGRQPTFTKQEEALFVEHISTLSECGFRFTNLEIKMTIRDYLNSRKRTVQIFRNNIPGRDWLKSFLDRHKSLYRHRINDRAQVSECSVTNFIELVRKETESVNPENIYNYDEISFGDDLLRNSVVWRREVKYPEFKANATNVGVSVVLCGNAAGESIPPFIIYASEHLNTSWTEDGPNRACYTHSKHGWLDTLTFETWFFNHILPIIKKKEGRKVLIGDNLSSHISRKVLSECKRHDIRFLCLPPHATQILQPLDIAYLEPLETIWRHVLLKWRVLRSEDDTPTTFNTDFPCLLRTALDTIPDFEENLILSFTETGIFPINTERALNRLKEFRIANARKKKLKEPPEKSADFSDLEAGPSSMQDEPEEIKNEIKEEIEDMPLSPSYTDLESHTYSNDFDLIIVDGDDYFHIKLEQDNSPKNLLKVAIGDHVIVTLGSCNYPGQVLSAFDDGAYVHCMKRKNFFWHWPLATNTQFFSWEAIICKIDSPKLVKKGCFSVPELL